jgi:hypothetical protein
LSSSAGQNEARGEAKYRNTGDREEKGAAAIHWDLKGSLGVKEVRGKGGRRAGFRGGDGYQVSAKRARQEQ